MRLKLYRAACVTEAMALARAELGPEAILLGTRRTAGGVELTAALEAPEMPMAPLAPQADLAWHGVPAAIATRLAAEPLETALASLFRFAPLPIGRQPLLLVGPPGAGKTLAAARLATRLVLAGTPPCIITADGRRAGAPEELAAYTRLLGIPLTVANEPATLLRTLRRAGDAPCIIDSAGTHPFAPVELDALAALAAAADATIVLVLPAGHHPEEAGEQAAAFAGIGARHLLASRLDLSRRLGSLVTAAAAGLDFTEAGTGPGIADLVPLTPALLATRLRTGPET